jgi:hypothetical protein
MSSKGGVEVKVRKLFQQYYEAIHALADTPKPRSLWIHELHDLTSRLEAELAALDSVDRAYLREELCAVLEREALDTTQAHRRDVLTVALKAIEYGGVDGAPR